MADPEGDNAEFATTVLDDIHSSSTGSASAKRRSAPSSSPQSTSRTSTPLSARNATPRTNKIAPKSSSSPGLRRSPSASPAVSALSRKDGRSTAPAVEASAPVGGGTPRQPSASRAVAPTAIGATSARQPAATAAISAIAGKRAATQRAPPRTTSIQYEPGTQSEPLPSRSSVEFSLPLKSVSPHASMESDRSTDEIPRRRVSLQKAKTSPLENMKAVATPRASLQTDSDALSPMTPSNRSAREAAIRVVVRVRPRLKREQSEPEGLETFPDGQSLALTNGRDVKRYCVDHIFDSRSDEGSQTEVFASFGRDLVNHSLKGYNVCLFAYGHTGSGKTYTIMGDGVTGVPNLKNQGAGILPRFLHAVFEARETLTSLPGSKPWICTCDYMEVYNETIRDLLSPAKTSDQRTRRVHVHPKYGVRVDNLSTSVVNSAAEALDLVNFGNQIRTVASTTMNERSSRSHAFFTFKYEQLGDDTNRVVSKQAVPELVRAASSPSPGTSTGKEDGVQSTITFVDLAGREDRAASKNQATTYREMCAINVSLFHLSHLIQKISENGTERNSLSDFRNSKLTMLLAQALTGNSRTALVATLAPLKCFFEDSCSTMSFATSAKKIETRPVVNNKSTKSMIAELEAEVKRLHRELELQKGDTSEKDAELATAQAMIAHYKRSWEEALSGSEENNKQRERLRSTLGLSPEERGHELPMERNGCVVPFLTKLSDDPSLQGCCNYFLTQQELRIGSDDGVCEVVLQGLGIDAEMCALVRDRATDAIEVSLLEAGADAVRVVVRGETLTREEPIKEVHHGDSIVLGYSHAFRLVVPTTEMMRDAEAIGAITALTIARSSIPKLDIASAVMERIEDIDVPQDLMDYLRELTARCPQSIVQSLLRDLDIVRPLVDEANLITKEILGHDNIHFELHALTDVLNFNKHKPDFVICVVEKPRALKKFQHCAEVVSKRLLRGFSARRASGSTGTESDTSKTDEVEISYVASKNPLVAELGLGDHMQMGAKAGDNLLVGVVALEEFLRRLNAIRDFYQDASDSSEGFTTVRQFLDTHPYSNPWHHATFQDIKLLAEVANTVRASPVMNWIMRKEGAILRTLETPLVGGTTLKSSASEPSMVAVGSMTPGSSESAPSTTPPSSPNLNAVETPKLPEAATKTSPHGFTHRRRRSRLLAPASPTNSHASPRSSRAVSFAMLPSELSEEPRMSAVDSKLNSNKTLAEHWKTMFMRQDFADVKLVAGNEPASPPIFAHRAALVRLPFFEQLLTATGFQSARPPAEVVVNSVGADSLRRILVYAYTDSTREALAGLSAAEIDQLALASSSCGLHVLERACEEGPIFRIRSLTSEVDYVDSEVSLSPNRPSLPTNEQIAAARDDQQIAQLRAQLEAADTIREEALLKCREEYEGKLQAHQVQSEHEKAEKERLAAELAGELESRTQEWATDRNKMKLLEEALQAQIAENTEMRVALWNTHQHADSLIDVSDHANYLGEEISEDMHLRQAELFAGGAVPELQPEDLLPHGAAHLSPREVVKELEKALEAQKAQLAELTREALAASHVYEEEQSPEPEVVWRPRRMAGESQSASSSAPQTSPKIQAVEVLTLEEQQQFPSGAVVADALRPHVATGPSMVPPDTTQQLQMLRQDLLLQLKKEIQAELCSIAPDLRHGMGSDVANDYMGTTAAMHPGSPGVLSTVASEVSELVQKLRADLRKSMKDEIQDQLMRELQQTPGSATVAVATPGASSRTTVATSPPAPEMVGKLVQSSSVADAASVPQVRRPVRSASVGSPSEWRRGGGGNGVASPQPWSPEALSYYRGQAPPAQHNPGLSMTVRRHTTASHVVRPGVLPARCAGPLLAPMSASGSPRGTSTPTRAISSGSPIVVTPPPPHQLWPPPSPGNSLASSAPPALRKLSPTRSVTLPVMTAASPKLSPRGVAPSIPQEPVARQPEAVPAGVPSWGTHPPMTLPAAATTVTSSNLMDHSRRHVQSLPSAASASPVQSPMPARRVLRAYPRVTWEYHEVFEPVPGMPSAGSVQASLAEAASVRR